VDHKNGEKEDNEIGEPYHEKAHSAYVSAVNIRSAVGKQEQHGSNLKIHKDPLPLFRKGLCYIDKTGGHRADTAEA
jgi:hypothetical protein